jgi:hypothetical protein
MIDKAGDVEGVMLAMLPDKVNFVGGREAVDDIPQGNLTWHIPLDSALAMLFAESYLTLIPFEKWKTLSMGARALQIYYGSHKKPHDVLISSLGKLLDLEGDINDQKRVVLKCLKELVDNETLLEATPATGRGDVTVHVVRAPWFTEIDTESGGEAPKMTRIGGSEDRN